MLRGEKADNHMAGIERLEMVVRDIQHPFAHVARIVGEINPKQPQLWIRPNIALRIEVGEVEKEEANQMPLTRVYTVRRFDREKNLIEIDFVIHEGDAPAMHWLDKAERGTSVFMIGPRQHFVPDYNLGKKIAFFADDTAIPALYAILSQWKDGAPQERLEAGVYIDCAEADYAKELPLIEGVAYHIHVRKPGEIAGKSGYLPLMAQSLSLERFEKNVEQFSDKKLRSKSEQLEQNWQIWVACEREEARAIRNYFVEQCGLEKEKIKAIGYWKHGVSASQLDHARLAYYARLHEEGKGLQQFEEFDVPV